MPFPFHTVELADGSNPNWTDRLVSGLQLAVANAGGAEGASVTTAVTFDSELPANYAVFVDSGVSGVVGTVTSRTSTGFSVVLTPLSSSTTIAAGTFNVFVVA
jgi:hypothetical protein